MTILKSYRRHLDSEGNGYMHRTHRTDRRKRRWAEGKSAKYMRSLRARGRMV